MTSKPAGSRLKDRKEKWVLLSPLEYKKNNKGENAMLKQ